MKTPRLIKRLRSGIVALKRVAVATVRMLRSVATDTDTYVFGGIALVGCGVGAMFSIPLAAIVTGGMLIGLGLWMASPNVGLPRRVPPRSEPEA